MGKVIGCFKSKSFVFCRQALNEKWLIKYKTRPGGSFSKLWAPCRLPVCEQLYSVILKKLNVNKEYIDERIITKHNEPEPGVHRISS